MGSQGDLGLRAAGGVTEKPLPACRSGGAMAAAHTDAVGRGVGSTILGWGHGWRDPGAGLWDIVALQLCR